MTGRDLDRLTLPYGLVDLTDGDRLTLCIESRGRPTAPADHAARSPTDQANPVDNTAQRRGLDL